MYVTEYSIGEMAEHVRRLPDFSRQGPGSLGSFILDGVPRHAPPIPTRPSALIRHALDCLRVIERDPRYVINMGVWNTVAPNGQCHVCFGGAVMAVSYGWSPRKTVDDVAQFPAPEIAKALNAARSGHAYAMFEYVGLNDGKGVFFDRSISHYDGPNGRFHRDMNRFADDLALAGY